MTVQYAVTPNMEQLEKVIALFEFVGGNARDALRVAINKTAPKVRTTASRAIREQIRLQASYVNERLQVRRATRSNLSAAVTTPSRGILLSRFSTDPLISGEKVSWVAPPPVPSGGIRVKVKPSGPVKIVTGDNDTEGKPFYVVLKNSRAIGIAARTKGSRKFKVFHGPSLSQVFNTVRDDVIPEAGQELTRQMLDAMRYLLAKQYPPEPI